MLVELLARTFVGTVQRHLHFSRFYQVQLASLHEAARILYICAQRFPILNNQVGVTFRFEINDLSLNQWIRGRGWHCSISAIRHFRPARIGQGDGKQLMRVRTAARQWSKAASGDVGHPRH